MKIQVILADQHRLVREGLSRLLAAHPDIEIVGQTGDGREALKLVRQLKPQVLVTALSLDGLSGVELTRAVAADAGTNVVIVSGRRDLHWVHAALDAGARAYVPKDADAQELFAAISTAAQGQRYLSSRLTEVLAAGLIGSRSPDASPLNQLSFRERQVLQSMAEGLNTKQIALELSISTKTVETHRAHLMHKLGLTSVAHLTKLAVREGLTSLE